MPSVTDAKDKGTEGNEERKLFSDISAVQVVATALASVTSMLLASYIGIAGSIIGVGVASVVSTMAASLYKRFLADSAEKIKELPDVVRSVAHHGAPDAGEDPEAPHEEAPLKETGSTRLAAEGHPLIQRKKRLIIICVASALVAVAATAGIIYVASSGEGLGAKPTPIILAHSEKPAPHSSADDAGDAPSDDAPSAAQNADDTARPVNAQNVQGARNAQNVQPTNAQDPQQDQVNAQPSNVDPGSHENATNASGAADAPDSSNASDVSDAQPANTTVIADQKGNVS